MISLHNVMIRLYWFKTWAFHIFKELSSIYVQFMIWAIHVSIQIHLIMYIYSSCTIHSFSHILNWCLITLLSSKNNTFMTLIDMECKRVTIKSIKDLWACRNLQHLMAHMSDKGSQKHNFHKWHYNIDVRFIKLMWP